MAQALEAVHDLPENVGRALDAFLDQARQALGPDLRSAVLYGSAAEGRLRPTSDVNLILVLSAFRPQAAEALRGPLRLGKAAIRLAVMFLLESEIEAAAEAFAAKFADVRRRRRVLLGPDVFATMVIPRAAEIARVKQVLLNLTLRLRAVYASEDHEDQLARALAEAAGPLRSCAAALLELEGSPVPQPREALARVAEEVAPGVFGPVLERLSEARQKALLPAGAAGPALLAMVDLATAIRARVPALPPRP